MNELEALFHIHIFGLNIGITSSIFAQWVIIAIVGGFAYFSTKNLNKIPGKRQNVLEMFVNFVNNLVRDNMGEEAIGFVPYIGTLIIFVLLMNLVGLFGIESPTEDYSVSLGLAAVSFFVIQGYAIKKHGFKSYIIGYAKPMTLLLPINIMERIMVPVSLSLRLFGNMTAGGVILGIVYKSMGKFAIGLPIPLHLYFDIFDGVIQTAIFVMLTMINIKIISEH